MIPTLKYILQLHIHALFPLYENSAIAEQKNIYSFRNYIKPKIHNGHITLMSKKENKEVINIIYALKYERHSHSIRLAQDAFAQVIEDLCINISETEKTEFIICTLPITQTRQATEQYDHMNSIAKGIPKRIKKIPTRYHKHVLKWGRPVKRQSQTKSFSERVKNVVGAMYATPYKKEAVHIVIDDLTTSGSILKEAKRALKKSGVSEIITIALASA